MTIFVFAVPLAILIAGAIYYAFMNPAVAAAANVKINR